MQNNDFSDSATFTETEPPSPVTTSQIITSADEGSSGVADADQEEQKLP